MSSTSSAGRGGKLTEAQRQAVRQQTMDTVLSALLDAAERKATAEQAAGRWDGLKQLRLDGLRMICAETEDFDLRRLSDLCYWNGLHAEFALVAKDGTKFTDVGMIPASTRQVLTAVEETKDA
ncbi:hypothetical protein ACLBYG_22620 [Methylobacterium sp. D53M]